MRFWIYTLFATWSFVSQAESLKPTNVVCSRPDDEGRDIAYVTLSRQPNSTLYNAQWRKGGIQTVENLDCNFSEQITHVVTCKGPDPKGRKDYYSTLTLTETSLVSDNDIHRKTELQIWRLSKSDQASDGFAGEQLLWAFYNS